MTEEQKYSATYKKISQFGPKIGVIKLNDSVVKDLIGLTDNILKDDNKISHGPYLGGQIREETIIDLDKLKEKSLSNFFNETLKHHALSNLNTERKLLTKITSMWIVSQREGEYNPVHWHEGCTLSAVMYLKIPEYIPRNIPGKNEKDGMITFINNNPSSPWASMEPPVISFQPEVGDMFIFPSRLMHCVYPFIGEGERRSVSLNAVHYFDDEKTRKIYL